MSFTLVESKCVDMTPKLAEEFRDLEPSPTERELDAKRIKHLEAKARDGLLVTFHWAKAHLKGRELRMNGQHSSNMLCGLNGNFPKGLKCHLDSYKVDDERDLALLFRQFDDRKSSRSSGDVAGAYQCLYKELASVPKKSAKLAIDGIAWWTSIVVGAPVPGGDERYTWFNREKDWPFIQWLGELLSMKTPELAKPPIVAAMYATWETNQDKCKEFWTQVARGGDEYDDNSASHVLDEWYRKAKSKDLAKPITAGEYYQAGIFAWNAFVATKGISKINCDTKKGFFEAA
jgi:hypothetical protein